MLKRYVHRLYRHQRGITGLETAIILIAFVVVASVFAYTVLSAGLFSSQKGQEAVHAGLQGARSSMEVVGNVKAEAIAPTTIDNADAAWTASASVTATTNTTDFKEGTGSAQLAVADLFATGLVAFRNTAAPVNLSTHFQVRLWIKASTAQAAGVLRVVLDDTAGCGSPLETLSLPSLSVGTWTRPIVKLANPAALTAVACVGITATADPGIVTINVDYVESPGEVSQVILVLANSLEGEAVNLTTTADADNDGLLSDEATKTHTMSVDYVDQTQRVVDITWTRTQRGKGDGDALLEAGEKFEIAISLKALNPLPVERTKFALHLRPQKGSAIVIEKTVPGSVDAIMDLN